MRAGSCGFQGLSTSTVTIIGGAFGGSGKYSGHATEVEILGGSFGSTGTYSALLHTWATGALPIQGGSFGGSGLGSGTYFVTDESTLTIAVRELRYHRLRSGFCRQGGVAFPGQPPQSISGEITGGRVLLEIVAPAPELRMMRTSSGLELSWTRSEANHVLAGIGGLTGPSAWKKWPEAPVPEGDPWVVRLAVVNHTDGAPSAVQLSRLNIVCRRNSGRTLAVAG